MDSIRFYNLVPYKAHACPATRNAELAGWLERALEAYAEEWLECSTARRETMTIGLSFLIICFAISMGIVCIVISVKALKKDHFIHIRRPTRLAETRRLGLVSAGFGIGCFMLLLLPNLVTLPAYFWRQSIDRSVGRWTRRSEAVRVAVHYFFSASPSSLRMIMMPWKTHMDLQASVGLLQPFVSFLARSWCLKTVA